MAKRLAVAARRIPAVVTAAVGRPATAGQQIGGSGVGGNGPCYQLGASGMHPCAADTACSAPQYAEPGDGTVTTTCCSLTWQQVVDAQDLDWNDAVTYCKNLSLAGGGWRLPTIGELESMLDHCESTPTVDARHSRTHDRTSTGHRRRRTPSVTSGSRGSSTSLPT